MKICWKTKGEMMKINVWEDKTPKKENLIYLLFIK